MTSHPGLILLLKEDETLDDLMKLTKEEILLRWFNYQLFKSSYVGNEVKNFSEDIKNSIAYIHVLKQISPPDQEPPLNLSPLNVNLVE